MDQTNFINIIATSDLDGRDKIKILDYALDECIIQGKSKNLEYLELIYIISNLKKEHKV